MKIIIPPDLLISLKNKHLLLDTNVFIDSLLHPAAFTYFFNELRSADITLVTIDLVKIEFLRGASDDNDHKRKEEFLEDITDLVLPTDINTVKNVYKLVKDYRIQGKTIAMADLYLGANLMRYNTTLYLLTRNTNDFPLRLFDLDYVINYPLDKGIFTYGVYKIKP